MASFAQVKYIHVLYFLWSGVKDIMCSNISYKSHVSVDLSDAMNWALLLKTNLFSVMVVIRCSAGIF